MDKATPKPSLNEVSMLKDGEEGLPQIATKQKKKCYDCGGKIVPPREIHGRTSPRESQGRTSPREILPRFQRIYRAQKHQMLFNREERALNKTRRGSQSPDQTMQDST